MMLKETHNNRHHQHRRQWLRFGPQRYSNEQGGFSHRHQ